MVGNGMASDGMEEHGLRRDARTEGHGATALTGTCALHEPLEDEHNRGRGHVAELAQDGSRIAERFSGQRESLFGCVKYGSAARMNSPEIDGGRSGAARDLRAGSLETAAKFARDLAGKLHVEALRADSPGDEGVGSGEIDCEEAVERETGRIRSDEIGGASIGKDEEGEKLLKVVQLLHVERAEFEAEKKDS